MAGCVWLTLLEGKLGTELWTGICSGVFWFLGAAFYLYMPLTSMTNPPMNWGYPRTWEGFIHAFTRGQYEKTNPTSDLGRFLDQLGMLFTGAVDEFNLVYLLIAVVPFLFFMRMQKREKGWMIGLSSLYLCLAVLLIVLLNTSPDRQSRDMNRVFFVASHVMISLWVGYGLAIIGALMLTEYPTWRRFGLYGGAGALGVALYAATVTFQTDRASMLSSTALFGLEASFDPLVRFTALFSLALAAAVILVFMVARTRPPMLALVALFAVMPAKSILSHWANNEQRGHLFGYWFGHDMFRPPFQTPESKPLYPEMARDAVLFGGTDPGRFAPTYMIFCESFIPPRCKPMDPTFDRRDVYLITQNALADGTYLNYIRAHYQRSTQIDPPFFQDMLRGRRDAQLGRTNVLARMVQPLDTFLLDFGARVEAGRRREGVFPSREIYIPNGEDHARCMNEYFTDAQRRHDLGQLKPGEDVRLDKTTGRLQVSGQVAVMAINALLAKVIFDNNPTHEFYVEESFPLDWMYPQLEPYGVIMKINREKIAEMTADMTDRDHRFWSLYCDRLIGNWITYDTSVRDICDFVVRVYEHRDFKGFTGDRKFIRDDQAQKSFSKLRSSIAGVYAWRFANAKGAAEQARMLKEADFAFRQAFAFCPYSPEAVLRYTTLLASVGRFEDAVLVAETSLRFDPDNQTIRNWARQIRDIQQGQGRLRDAESRLGELERTLATNPADSRAAFDVASVYLMLQRTNDALRVLDQLLAQSNPPPGTILSIANAFAQLGQGPRLEIALGRLTALTPNSPEVWYDLASTRALLGKSPESIEALRRALELDAQRRASDPNARNLAEDLKTNAGFDSLRSLPAFQKLASAR
jgi:tetratricopeptide (TPR) repeat protein